MHESRKLFVLPEQVLQRVVEYLESKSVSEDMRYYNRYGAETPELLVVISTSQITWQYSRPQEIISGSIVILDRISRLCILEEVAKLLVSGHYD